jgi:CheY-like chemotaxis protein/HPt (histidine-containing phosphotransfer) domain-containing protein
VLLTEDNVVNQKVAARFLERLGCSVQIAADGAQAVQACQQAQFDLILMDLQMPVMDGLTATHHIRALPSYRARPTPIVALTANAMVGQSESCLRAGMNGFLTKPIDIAKLQEVLQSFGLGPETMPPVNAVHTPVDLNRLEQTTRSDPALTEQLAAAFAAAGREALQELHCAVHGADGVAIACAAHQLQGASAQVHARVLQELARSMEASVVAATPAELAEQLARLGQEYQRAAAFLEQYAQGLAIAERVSRAR